MLQVSTNRTSEVVALPPQFAGLGVARALAVPVCIALIAFSALNLFPTAVEGFDWLPQLRLRLEFNSPGFMLIFLPCTLALYSLYRRSEAANWILASASVAVYATVGLIYLLPLLFTCAVDYAVGQYLASSINETRRRIAFIASVVCQISLLCTFKYVGWLSGEFGKALTLIGVGAAFLPMSLPLPPGISFYTFHTISYTADIYRYRFKPIGNLIDYITFVAFFPQLIAGPIARASELLPQVAAKRPRLAVRQAEEAIWLIAWGLFKKLCLADNFGLIVAQTIEALHKPEQPVSGGGYIFMYAFAAQIYCDFSAYTDIARGIAKLFGIELTRNFLTPYFAISPSDFWHRWHISLSRWLRDYLYIPLGGDQHGRLKTLRNLGITMFLGGLWHGAGVGFIVWGLYHGLLLVLYRLFPVDHLLERHLKRIGTAIAILLMFNLACIGWIFFRAQSNDILPLFSSMSHLPEIQSGTIANRLCWQIALFAAPLIVTEALAYWKAVEFVDLYARSPTWLRCLFYVAIFYSALFLAPNQTDTFIYFRF